MKNTLRRPGNIHLLVVGLYTLLAVVMTWPVVRHLGTHVPGSYTWAFDEYTFLWNSWWFRYSLFDLGQNPLISTHTFYPLGISLALYTYNLLNALISLPLQPFLSLPAISNLTFLFATVLSAYGTFLLVEYLLRSSSNHPTPLRCGDDRQAASGNHRERDLLRSQQEAQDPLAAGVARLAAFLSGLIYALGSYRMVYAAIGHYDMWSTAWIPFYALYLVKTIHEPRCRNAVLAGLFLVLAMLCEMIFGVCLGILTLVVLVFVFGKQGRREVAGGLAALLKRLIVMGSVATLLYSGVLVPVLREMFGGYELAGWGDAQKLSVDLLGFVTPTALHPLGGDWVATLQRTREGIARFSDVNTVALGWAGLALALAGAVLYRRRLVAWTTSFVVFALLSLGPLLQINGRSVFDLDGLEVNVPLPFILLHYLPVIKANRVPNRFSVVLMLTLAVLAGFGAYGLLRRAASSRVQAARSKPSRRDSPRSRQAAGVVVGSCCLLLVALLLFDHWSVPLPLTDARIPPVYQQIAGDPGDFAILQLPLGWRNSFGEQGAESTQTQYYQSYHHKRLLSGNISRNPPFKFDYFRRVTILDSLVTLETYGQVDAARRAGDRASAAEFVSFYDIRYVVVAPGIPGRPPYVDTRDAAVAYVEEVLPVVKVYDQDGWLLYRVDQPPSGLPSVQAGRVTTFTVDFGRAAPLEAMALGEGWSGAEEIQGASAQWAVAQDARVFLPSVPGAEYRLTLKALPFDYPGADEQGVTLWVNGHRLPALPRSGTGSTTSLAVTEASLRSEAERAGVSPGGQVPLSVGWGTYTWNVPSGFLRQGLACIGFEFERLDAPADVLPGSGAIGKTGVQAPVAIEVNSGGPADFAYISVEAAPSGQSADGSVHRPGYNVAVIDPKNGRILDRRGFDTTASGNQAEADALAEYIAGVPAGQVVAVAMQGDGTAHLTDGAVAALRSIGAQVDPRGNSGWSHAIVGVKGAAPGAALEAAGLACLDCGQSRGVGWLRVAPDLRTLAIAVDLIVWEPIEK